VPQTPVPVYSTPSLCGLWDEEGADQPRVLAGRRRLAHFDTSWEIGAKTMLCPFCKSDNDKVVDSRASEGGAVIRRRRECLECQRRYTTYERVEEIPLRVVKKDGTRQPFDRTKVLSGLIKACEKRPVATDALEQIVGEIEHKLADIADREVSSRQIGEMVMQHLRELDQVAYVRFASVYRAFKDINQFLEELRPMLERRARTNGKDPGST